MAKGILAPLFPATRRDVSRLKQSATDAVNDLSGAATSHANKVGGQLQDFAEHLHKEGSANFDRAKGKLSDIVSLAREFANQRPLVCIGAALAVGILIGLSRRRRPAPQNE